MQQYPGGLEQHEYWIILAIACVLALAAFYYAARCWRRARLIEDVPTAKVRSAHQGYVELEGDGRLMNGTPIIAPLTNKQCVWYRYKIERKETRHTNNGTQTKWVTEREETSDNLFHLHDETGFCVVDPEGAEVTCDDKVQWYGHASWPTDAPALFGGSGVSGLLESGRYRYTEWLVLPNQPLYIIGQFQSMSPAQQYSVNEITRDLIRTWKKDPSSMLERFDANGDGKIDHDEWELVRKSAKMHAQKEHRERAKQPDIHIISKPENDQHPFLLSVYPQEQLTKRYRLHAYLSLAGFFVAGSVVAWLFQF